MNKIILFVSSLFVGISCFSIEKRNFEIETRDFEIYVQDRPEKTAATLYFHNGYIPVEPQSPFKPAFSKKRFTARRRPLEIEFERLNRSYLEEANDLAVIKTTKKFNRYFLQQFGENDFYMTKFMTIAYLIDLAISLKKDSEDAVLITSNPENLDNKAIKVYNSSSKGFSVYSPVLASVCDSVYDGIDRLLSQSVNCSCWVLF